MLYFTKLRKKEKSWYIIDSQFIMFFIPYSHGIIKYLKHEFFIEYLHIYCSNYVQTSSNVMSTFLAMNQNILCLWSNNWEIYFFIVVMRRFALQSVELVTWKTSLEMWEKQLGNVSECTSDGLVDMSLYRNLLYKLLYFEGNFFSKYLLCLCQLRLFCKGAGAEATTSLKCIYM